MSSEKKKTITHRLIRRTTADALEYKLAFEHSVISIIPAVEQ